MSLRARLQLGTALGALAMVAMTPVHADPSCVSGGASGTLDCSFQPTDATVTFSGPLIAGASEINIDTSGNQDMSATSGQPISVVAGQDLSTVLLGPLQFSNGFAITQTGATAGAGYDLGATIGQIFVFPSVGNNVAAASVISQGGESSAGGAVTVTTSLTAVGDQTRTLPDGTEASDFILNRATGSGNSGIVASSTGGDGDDGHDHTFHDGGDGDNGGVGGAVNVTTGLSVGTNGATSDAIHAESRGGDAGSGGDGGESDGGDGGQGGAGGAVTVDATNASGWIYTKGDASLGIFAQSVGGYGGGAGDGNGIGVDGGDAGAGGNGGAVQVTNAMHVQTAGDDSIGVLAQSVGAQGGGGGGTKGIFNSSTGGGPGGSGGAVTLANSGSVATSGALSFGLQAQSIGGGGGSGGSEGDIAGFGSTGGSAANGGTVTITQSGTVATSGAGAYAVLGQSIGGGGGSAGSGKGIYSAGGSGSSGGDGGKVTMTIDAGAQTGTSGDTADAVLLQSIGGGGGAGGKAGGVASYGGSGGGGGDGGVISLTSAGTTTTTGSDATALHAQSIGGGGGDGGGAIAAGVELSVAIGGSGGSGGAGDDASVTQSGTVGTTGDRSDGVLAESVGGGGGSGGYSVAVAVGVNVSASVSLGGKGGGGGDGALAEGVNEGTITTTGDHSAGVVASSIGGGGGSGGYAAAGSLAAGQDVSLAASVAIGGKGGGGGDGGTAYAENAPASSAGGSAGGGGSGDGGGPVVEMMALDATPVSSGPTISTAGAHAAGLVAQSIGGGGGNGGFSVAVAAGLSTGAGLSSSVSLGGQGGSGGTGGDAEADNLGTITTAGAHSDGILVQSIGGGGGSGGSATSGSAVVGKTGSFSASVAVGGSGASGATGGSATAKNVGTVTTAESLSAGVVAQAIGGGGGDGGHADTYSLSAASGTSGDDAEGGTSVNVSIALGGSGGTGGTGGTADVQNTGTITTAGPLASGIVSQSIGGGGGSGGWAESIALTATRARQSEAEGSEPSPGRALAIAVDIGGSGSSGGDGGAASAWNQGTVTTADVFSYGIFVQSVGGGGGSGGNAKSYTATGVKDQPKGTTDKVGSLSIEIGGKGGSGGAGGGVGVINDGSVITGGLFSDALLAQSVGGGGGTGGSAGMYSAGTNLNGNFTFSLGGAGGSGGKGGDPDVQNTGVLQTTGDFADGMVVQSVGGGGGNAGEAMTDTIGGGDAAKKIGVSVGGSGGKGGGGGQVTATSSGTIGTTGGMAIGVLAQSVGGGGGIAAEGSGGISYQLSIGGSGGVAGDGGSVEVTQNGSVSTTGTSSYGIFAQSVGGGGGLAGAAIANPKISPSKNPKPVEGLAIGGSGGSAGDGGQVSVARVGQIGTTGDFAIGVLAQSVGGGGGTAGSATSSGIIPAGLSLNPGGSGNGGTVNVALGKGDNITTTGLSAIGVLAQSVGGGGGVGGDVSVGLCFGKSKATKCVSHDTDLLDTETAGSVGSGGTVAVALTGAKIATTGDFAHGIFAQSVGGGGGLFGGSATTYMASGVAGIGAATGGAISVSLDGASSIVTSGDAANGIVAIGHGAEVLGLTFAEPMAVSNAGTIRVTGDGSYGVYMNYTTPTKGSTSFDNSGVISGATGAVFINGTDASATNSGSITASADEATAFEAGDGVALTNSGEISATGASASALVLDQDGTIANSGVIKTLTAESTALSAAGNLTLSNTGTISAPGNLVGTAVSVSGTASIDNAGLISGDVNIVNRGGTFVNEAAGILEPYARLAVGQDANGDWGAITDKGTLSPGGTGVGGWPVVYADSYVQTATGTYKIDLSEDFMVSDNTVFIGDATFGGRIAPTYSVAAGYALDPILIASVEGTADTSATRVTNSAAVTYALSTQINDGLTQLYLTPTVDLTVTGLTTTETSAADYMQSIHDGLASGGATASRMAKSAAPRPGAAAATSMPGHAQVGYLNKLLNAPTVSALRADLGAIDFRVYPASYLAAIRALDAAATDMLTCGDQFHAIAPVGGCRWGKVLGAESRTEQDGVDVTDRSGGVGGGLRAAPGGDWRFDLSGAYVENTTSANAAKLTTDLFTLGAAATWASGRVELAAGAMLGYGAVSSDRKTTDGVDTLTAHGDTDAFLAGARFRAGYAFGSDALFLKPLVDVDLTHLDAGAFTESGAGDMNLAVDAAHDTLFSVTPRVELGMARTLPGEQVLRGFLSLGAAFQRGDIDGGARFASVGGAYDGMANSVAEDDVLGVVRAGIDVAGTDRMSVKLTYGGAFGDHTQMNEGAIEISWRF